MGTTTNNVLDITKKAETFVSAFACTEDGT